MSAGNVVAKAGKYLKTCIKENAIFTLLVNIFFSFTLIIYGPYEIFIGNYSHFEFTFRDIWQIMPGMAIRYLILSLILLCFLPKRINELCNRIIFSFTFCCYLQAMFLNSKMYSFTGFKSEWNKATVYGNLVFWIIVMLAILLLPLYAKKWWKAACSGLAGAITVMQLAGFASLLLTTPALSRQVLGYISTNHMLDLSQKENVIVFISDCFDARIMEMLLEEEPDYLDFLDGFTYFTNATSVHSRTYPSLTYLLTEQKCYYDKEGWKWINEASDTGSFLPALKKNGIDIGLYMQNWYIGSNIRGLMCNFEPSKLEIDETVVKNYLKKMILYRDLPYVAKKTFDYEDVNINSEAIKASEEDLFVERYQEYDDVWLYNKICEEGLTASLEESAFRFYLLYGPHTDFSNPVFWGKYSLDLMNVYFDYMKELGLYRDATIIITADHGYSGGGDDLDMPHETAVPIMFVKPSGAEGTPLQRSEAPVSHEDFFPTVLDGFAAEKISTTGYAGRNMMSVQEDEVRERYYYYTAFDFDGEIVLREYLVNGNANDPENYHYTGQSWEILYSINRLADEAVRRKAMGK